MSTNRAALSENLRAQHRGFSKLLESELLEKYIHSLSDDELNTLTERIESVSAFQLFIASNILKASKQDPNSELYQKWVQNRRMRMQK